MATGPSSWELSNGLVKTTFVGGREQAYFTNLGGAWVQGAFAPAIEVAAKSFPETFPASVKDRLSIPGLPAAYAHSPPTVYAGAGGGVVPLTNESFVLAGGGGNLTLRYALPLESGMWAAEVAISLAAGATHVREVVRFRRLRRAPAGAEHGDLVRVRKVYRSPVLPRRLV